MLVYMYMAELFKEVFHTVIVGAGAAGLMCAGSFTRRKLLLEHNPAPGAKISVSGGGKCNFSNRSVTARCYRSGQKHFCKNALAGFTTNDFLALLQTHAVAWEERAHGQLFAKSAKDVVSVLTERARKANTLIKTAVQVLDIRPENGFFTLHTSAGTVTARHVVVTAGGPSYPQLGATNFAVTTARRLGISTVEQHPVLAGFVLPRELKEMCRTLAGNAVPAEIKTGKFSYRENILFTHEGISGPAVLQASLFWNPGEAVSVNLLPDEDAARLLEARKQSARRISAELENKLPAKITKTLLGPLDRDLANASKAELHAAARKLNAWTFVPVQTAGYSKAEASSGGVDAGEINPHTMECKKIPGLFFAGEALDVTGMVGGFNLHWAWCSGAAAARELQKRG